ncbi:MAG: hypothetical protein ACT4P1_10600, partial [Sporichthyaceae bacterium]
WHGRDATVDHRQFEGCAAALTSPAPRGTAPETLPSALAAINLDHAALYHDVVLAMLPLVASRYLEALMSTSYEYQSEFARRYFFQGRAEGEAEGEAKGEAKAVLAFLGARGIDVPDDVRARINSCTDLDQLDAWVRRATTATTADDLFE